MFIKNIKQHPILKYIINPYILMLLGFIIWMLFFDDNSFLFHRKLNTIMEEKKFEIKLYENKIKNDKEDIKKLSNEDNLENFAREEYYMKKENEEIYIIEHSNKTNTKNNE